MKHTYTVKLIHEVIIDNSATNLEATKEKAREFLKEMVFSSVEIGATLEIINNDTSVIEFKQRRMK